MILKRYRIPIVISVLLLGGLSTRALPYDIETHRVINHGAVNRSSLNDYLIRALDLPKGITTIFGGRNVLEWIREGGALEDDPITRTANHFHYPLREWDRALLTDPPGSGFAMQSSVLWAQNPDQRPFLAPAETWSWIRARRELRDAFTMPDVSDRNTAFANTFRAIGQGLHLIADASVPAHTRNDSHVSGEPLEMWVEAQAQRRPNETPDEARARFLARFAPISEHFSPSILGTAPNPLAPIPIAKVFDADAYDGTAGTLGLTGSLAVGITEFTNANFFSYSTVFADRFGVTHPRFSPFPASTAVEQFIDPTNNRRYWRKTSPGATVEHLATVSRLDFFRQLLVGGPPRTGGLDRVVHDEYARHLIPRAVGYSASLLDYFFRGTLDFTVSASSSSANQNGLTITNTSAEAMDGIFTLYADNFSEVRSSVQGASFNLTLGPGTTSGPLSFTPPSQVQAYVLVFQGRLGIEDDAVAGKINKWYTVTNVTPGKIIPGQPSTLTVTIKSNFRQTQTLVAALFDGNATHLASTAVIIQNTAPTTTKITLDITSTTIPTNAPRPISVVIAADVDMSSITTTDVNAKTPVNVIMNLVRVGQNSRLPIYLRGVSGELMQVAVGPGHFLFVCPVFGVNPEMVTLKYNNVKDFFIQYLSADDDFDPQLLNQGIVLNGSQTQFQTITLKLDTLVDQFGNKAVNHFLQGRGDLVDANAFVCIRSISELSKHFTQFGFGICDIGTRDFKTRECPE